MFDPLQWRAVFDAPLRLSPSSSWVEHIPFGMQLVEMMKPAVLVELGTQRGDSLCAFCQTVKTHKLPTRCWGVDTWPVEKEMPVSGDDSYSELKFHHDPLYGSFSTLIRSTFDAALSQFEDGQIDLLHVDGMHDYESVKHDYETWLPRMSERGVILFHDSAVRDKPNFGVWKLMEEITRGRQSFEFAHGYGLTVVAVGKDVPAPVMQFIEWANANREAAQTCYRALGNRVLLMQKLMEMLYVIGGQRNIFKQWRQITSQPLPAAFDLGAAQLDPAKFAADASFEVQSLANDAIRLAQAVAQFKAQIEQSQKRG